MGNSQSPLPPLKQNSDRTSCHLLFVKRYLWSRIEETNEQQLGQNSPHSSLLPLRDERHQRKNGYRAGAGEGERGSSSWSMRCPSRPPSFVLGQGGTHVWE